MSFKVTKVFFLALLIFIPQLAWAQSGLPIINMIDDGSGSTQYSLTLQ